MPIYWMFLGTTLVLIVWCNSAYNYVYVDGFKQKRVPSFLAIAFGALVIFFCGLRSGIADTGTYIYMFDKYPSRLSELMTTESGKDQGFTILSVAYKQFISTDFHGWLFLISLISGIAVFYAFWKYSEDFAMTCFLFIATTTFTYFVNGMRQFICIAIVLAASQLVIDRNMVKYGLVVLLLSTIHGSTLIMIPAYFLAKMKPWSRTMWMGIGATAIVGLGFNRIFNSMSWMLEETQYEGYISYINENGVGSNVIRLFIALVPVVMAFAGQEIIEAEASRMIKMCVNMSVLNACIYFVATFSSGMVLGRLAAFFDIYNLILLPWLINHIFEPRSVKLVKWACILTYIAYFYFQMVMTWHIGYESDILHMYW